VETRQQRSRRQEQEEEAGRDANIANMNVAPVLPGNQPAIAPGDAAGLQPEANVPPGVVVPPLAPSIFALSPARATLGVLDYSLAAHVKLYHKATAALPIIFDGDAANLQVFLRSLGRRANTMGWRANIFAIPTASGTLDLLDSFGTVSLDDVRAHALTYVGMEEGPPARMAQNAEQLAACLADSLTKETLRKVETRRREYTLGGTEVGPMFLKVVIASCYIDTMATSTSIRLSLSRLDEYIGTVDADIEKFNQYVRVQLDGLAARGESTSDTLVNLFKAYEVVPDKTFRDYVSQKRSLYEEGQVIEPEALMTMAENKYKALVESRRWNLPTEEERRRGALGYDRESYSR
jgi:hypothetical protein